MSIESPVPVDVLLSRAREGLKAGHADKYCLPLLPLLEHPWAKGAKEIVACASKCQEFSERAETIPSEVVSFALAEDSQYWVGLALAWIEDGFPVSPALKTELFAVSQKRHLLQWQRHSAWRLFHKEA